MNKVRAPRCSAPTIKFVGSENRKGLLSCEHRDKSRSSRMSSGVAAKLTSAAAKISGGIPDVNIRRHMDSIANRRSKYPVGAILRSDADIDINAPSWSSALIIADTSAGSGTTHHRRERRLGHAPPHT